MEEHRAHVPGKEPKSPRHGQALRSEGELTDGRPGKGQVEKTDWLLPPARRGFAGVGHLPVEAGAHDAFRVPLPPIVPDESDHLIQQHLIGGLGLERRDRRGHGLVQVAGFLEALAQPREARRHPPEIADHAIAYGQPLQRPDVGGIAADDLGIVPHGLMHVVCRQCRLGLGQALVDNGPVVRRRRHGRHEKAPIMPAGMASGILSCRGWGKTRRHSSGSPLRKFRRPFCGISKVSNR